MRILLIEDNEIDCMLVERALGDQYTLSRATTLAAGLELAGQATFDLVILDLTLDDSTGYGTFEKMREAVPHTPIIILSGLDDEALALRAVSNGAQDYVSKSRLLLDHTPLDRAARYAIERQRVEDRARKSEQQYRALFDNLPVAAYTCDADGLITYYNQKAVELWGREPALNNPADRFTGSYKSFDLDGRAIAVEESWMARALKEGKGFNAREIIIERPNGETCAVLAHANPVLDENGVIRGGINVFVDITEKRRAERELRESERLARSTVNSLTAHIAILDETGTILSVNNAWKRFAENNGMTTSGYGVGTNYLAVCNRAACGSDDVARAVSTGIRSILNGSQQEVAVEYPCHSPEEQRWFVMRATPFEGEGPRRVVVLHADITQRLVAERLAREQFGLREAVTGMEKVLGVVAHELRTPLAALRAISEFLMTDGARDAAEGNRFLKDMSEEVDRMSDTIDDLLEAARLNSGRARWNWAEIDVAAVIERAVASIRPLVDGERVSIDVHIDTSTGKILGDGDAIRRLLLNLLSNARKHTEQGKIEIRCERYADSIGNWLELIVKDTGCGIAPEVLERVGEAFALNSGVVGGNHVKGTGLGLAICKGIAEAHGGNLRIESVLGQGTTIAAKLRVDLEVATQGDTVHRETCCEEITV
jgi:PAS domain S-box-containing protein